MATENAFVNEKLAAEQVDDVLFRKPSRFDVDGNTNADDDEFSLEEQKRIIRRIDLRVTLTCGAIYCISLMDRTNLGAASIAG